MDLDQTVMVAGIGCRSGVSTEQVESALESAVEAAEAALRNMTPAERVLTAIATPATKSHEPGIIAVAASRGIALVLISQADLEAANPATLTHSEHSMAAMNVHSVAEAAALAGAGPTARLLGPRIVTGPVTCALAYAVIHARAGMPASTATDAAAPTPNHATNTP